MRNIYFFYFLLSSTLLLGQSNGLPLDSNSIFNTGEAYVENFMNDWGVPGLTMCVAKDGEVKYMKSFGYAQVENEEPSNPYHIYRIASVSKSITAIGIMKLVETGQLNLSDKVFGIGGILENFADIQDAVITDERIYDITVQNLLEHSAGWDGSVNCFPNPTTPYPWFFGGCNPKDASLHVADYYGVSNPPPASLLIRFLLEKGLNYTPGSKYVYSNQGYSTLGRVIEAVTDMRYETYIKTAILHPLGIYDTHVGNVLPQDFREREARYYGEGYTTLSIYGTGEMVPWEYGGQNFPEMDALGGWTTTARDLIRLMHAIDGFATKPDILSPSTIQTMTTPSVTNPYYALGFGVNAVDNWWHNGALDGTFSLWVRTHDGYTWTIINNKRITGTNANAYRTAFDNLGWQFINSVSSWPEWDFSLVPTQNSSELTVTAVDETSVNLSWSPGNGTRRLVLAKPSNRESDFPYDGNIYEANATYGVGDNLGNDNFVVYEGEGSAVMITGLEPETSYTFKVIEFNQSEKTNHYPLYQLGENPDITVSTTSLGIEDQNSQNVVLYPNPTEGILNIDLNQNGRHLEYECISLEGRVVRSGILEGKNNKINVEDFSKGIYFMRITHPDKKIEIQKFIVK